MTEVDTVDESIYCHHAVMGEEFIEEHSHRKGQFLYTEGGMVYLSVGQKSYFLPARHYIWIPAGTRHSIHPSNPNVIMRNLYFPIDEIDDDFYSKIGIYHVNDLLMEMILFTNRWNGHIIPDDLKRYTIAKSFKLLLPELSSESLTLSLPYPKSEKLIEVIQYLENNLSENISFKTLSEKFSISERTLARLFQKDLSMSFIQYYTILRMLVALKYLLNEKRSVQDVASKVGYSSIPTFSNTFYKFIGKRPSDYMKERKGII